MACKRPLLATACHRGWGNNFHWYWICRLLPYHASEWHWDGGIVFIDVGFSAPLPYNTTLSHMTGWCWDISNRCGIFFLCALQMVSYHAPLPSATSYIYGRGILLCWSIHSLTLTGHAVTCYCLPLDWGILLIYISFPSPLPYQATVPQTM